MEKPTKSSVANLTSSPLPSIPDPPSNLGPSGQELWARVLFQHAFKDSRALELLSQACVAADRAEAMRKRIDQDGELVKGGKYGPKAHPLLREELAARNFIARCMARLGLDIRPTPNMGRPGGRGIGVSWEYFEEQRR